MADAEFWTDRGRAEMRSKELADVKREIARWENIEKENAEIAEIAEVAEGDPNLQKELAGKIAAKPAQAVRLALKAMQSVKELPQSQGESYEASLFALTTGTEDFKEGTHDPNIDSVDKLFTKRNLVSLTIIFNAISKVKEEKIKTPKKTSTKKVSPKKKK